MLVSGEAVVRFTSTDETYTQPADFDLDDVWGGLNQTCIGIQRMCTRRGPTSLTSNQEEYFKLAHQRQQHWIGEDLNFLSSPTKKSGVKANYGSPRPRSDGVKASKPLPKRSQHLASAGHWSGCKQFIKHMVVSSA